MARAPAARALSRGLAFTRLVAVIPVTYPFQLPVPAKTSMSGCGYPRDFRQQARASAGRRVEGAR